jgi:hypothetical protein
MLCYVCDKRIRQPRTKSEERDSRSYYCKAHRHGWRVARKRRLRGDPREYQQHCERVRRQTRTDWTDRRAEMILKEIRDCERTAKYEKDQTDRAWKYGKTARRYRRLLRVWWSIGAPASAALQAEQEPSTAMDLFMGSPFREARLAPTATAIWATAYTKAGGSPYSAGTFPDGSGTRAAIKVAILGGATHQKRLAACTVIAARLLRSQQEVEA